MIFPLRFLSIESFPNDPQPWVGGGSEAGVQSRQLAAHKLVDGTGAKLTTNPSQKNHPILEIKSVLSTSTYQLLPFLFGAPG